MVGTTAGHNPAARRALISASAVFVCDESLEKPPLSRTSTSTGSTEFACAYATCDGVSLCPLASGRFANFGGELVEVLGRGVECVQSFEFGPQRNLKQFRCWQSAPLQLVVEIVGEIHLDTRHAPKYTHLMDQAIRGRRWTHAAHRYRRLGVREDLRGNPAR